MVGGRVSIYVTSAFSLETLSPWVAHSPDSFIGRGGAGKSWKSAVAIDFQEEIAPFVAVG